MGGYVSAGIAIWVSLAAGAAAFAQEALSIDRGQYLVTIGICGSCHTPKDAQGNSIPSQFLGGGHRVGGIFASNITPDKDTGLGAWTDAQIVEAIRNGRRPDGEPVRPPMGVHFYRGLSDADVQAVVAYLRTVKPVRNLVERVESRGPSPTFDPVANVSAPSRSDKLAWGQYVGETIAHCFQCHTPRKGGLPDRSRLGAGGNSYTARGGGQVAASNITPAHIGTWTDDQLKDAITKGVRPDGGQLAPVMDFEMYAQLTPYDLDALVAYIRSLPPAT